MEGLMVHTNTVRSPTHMLDYTKYSNVQKYVWIVARIYHSLLQKTFSAIKDTSGITPQILKKARHTIIKDVQQIIGTDLQSPTKRNKGKYSRLHPVQDTASGIWVVGNRLIRNNPMATKPNLLPALLPGDHPMTNLLLREAHVRCGHRGRDITLATFRQEYWTVQGYKLARKVVNDCQLCRVRNWNLLSQQMGNLPAEKLAPTHPLTELWLISSAHM